MTWAHIERFGSCERQCSGVMRIFEDGQQFGDSYRYVLHFRFVADNVVELFGVANSTDGRPPTVSEARAALLEFSRRGWRVVRDRKAGARQGLREISRKKV